MQSSYKISRKSLNHNYLNFVEIVNRMSILMIFRYNIYKNGKRNKMNTLPIFFLKSFFSVGLTISHLLYCSLSLLVWWAKYLFFMITMHSYFDLLLSPLMLLPCPSGTSHGWSPHHNVLLCSSHHFLTWLLPLLILHPQFS